NLPSLISDFMPSMNVIVPVSLSPWSLSVRVDIRFMSPISYSHFQVPVGSAFLSSARTKPASPSTTTAARIAFMVLPSRAAGEEGPRTDLSGRPEHFSHRGTSVDGGILRPKRAGSPERVLPVDWKAITQDDQTATNYQVLTGDRNFVKSRGPVGADPSLAFEA